MYNFSKILDVDEEIECYIDSNESLSKYHYAIMGLFITIIFYIIIYDMFDIVITQLLVVSCLILGVIIPFFTSIFLSSTIITNKRIIQKVTLNPGYFKCIYLKDIFSAEANGSSLSIIPLKVFEFRYSFFTGKKYILKRKNKHDTLLYYSFVNNLQEVLKYIGKTPTEKEIFLYSAGKQEDLIKLVEQQESLKNELDKYKFTSL